MKEVRTTFFTVANRAYEMFVLPYIASVLFFNDDARVEICLEDTQRFEAENARALAVIRQYFGKDNWLLRDGDFSIVADSVRFLETPKGPVTEYVYISDIDVLILQSGITDDLVARMADTGLPYCNVMEPGMYGEVLTGQHFSRWDAFYPQCIPEGTPVNMDRALLTAIIRAKGYGFPQDKHSHQFFGIHISPNQVSGLLEDVYDNQELMINAYRQLCESPMWKALFPTLPFQYRIAIKALDLAQLVIDSTDNKTIDGKLGSRAYRDNRINQLLAEKAQLKAKNAEDEQRNKRLEAEKMENEQRIRQLKEKNAEDEQRIRQLKAKNAEDEQRIRRLMAKNAEGDKLIRSIMTKIRTTFFTVANRPYEMFVLPYIASVLFFNDDARVEICLEDTQRFEAENAQSLAILRKYLGEDRWLLRDGMFSAAAASVRFLEKPKGDVTEYVYIDDIDTLILRPGITDLLVARMADTGLPYCNVLQPGKHGEVLAGRHFSRWDAFYPQCIPEGTRVNFDRELLTAMIQAKGYGFPSLWESKRGQPYFGIHISPNQVSRLVEQIHNKQNMMVNPYRKLCESPIWKALFPTLSFQYRIAINAVDLAQLVVGSMTGDHVRQIVQLKAKIAEGDQRIRKLKTEREKGDQRIRKLKTGKDHSDDRIRRMLARPWYRRIWSAK